MFGVLYCHKIKTENFSSRHFRRLVSNAAQNSLNTDYDNSHSSSNVENLEYIDEEIVEEIEIEESNFTFVTDERVFLDSIDFDEPLENNTEITENVEPACSPLLKLKLKISKWVYVIQFLENK